MIRQGERKGCSLNRASVERPITKQFGRKHLDDLTYSVASKARKL